MRGRWDAKITLGITGLHPILGRDYGIEEPYWASWTELILILKISFSRFAFKKRKVQPRFYLKTSKTRTAAIRTPEK